MSILKSSTKHIALAVIGIMISVALSSVSAWEPPTSGPLGNNAPGPIHQGDAAQVMDGSLSVRGFIANGGGVLVPFGSTGSVDLVSTGLWTGGKIRAADFCLNDSPLSCLSSVASLPATEESTFVAGMATFGSSVNFCHPFVGGCTNTDGKTLYRSETPSAETIVRNFKVRLSTPAPSGYGCVFKVRATAVSCEDPTTNVVATCTVNPGATECNGTGTATIPGLNCMVIQNERTNDVLSGCSTTASWTYELSR